MTEDSEKNDSIFSVFVRGRLSTLHSSPEFGYERDGPSLEEEPWITLTRLLFLKGQTTGYQE